MVLYQNPKTPKPQNPVRCYEVPQYILQIIDVPQDNSLVSITTLSRASRFERTSSHERRFALFTEERTTGLEFGRLANITISKVENRTFSWFRFRGLLHLVSHVLLMELLHPSSLFHINGSISWA
jgi:hypothetical protein